MMSLSLVDICFVPRVTVYSPTARGSAKWGGANAFQQLMLDMFGPLGIFCFF